MAGGRLMRVCLPLGVLLVVYNFMYNGSDVLNAKRRVLKEVRSERPLGQPHLYTREDTPASAPPAAAEAHPTGCGRADCSTPSELDDVAAEPVPASEPAAEPEPPASEPAAELPVAEQGPLRSRTHSVDVRKCAPKEVLSASNRMDHGMDVPHRPLNWIVPPQAEWPAAGCSPSALCAEVRRVAGADRQVLLVIAGASSGSELQGFVASAAQHGVADQILVAALDDAAAALAKGLQGGAGVWRVPEATVAAAASAQPAQKYFIAAAVLATGCSVIYADLRTRFGTDPFGYVFHDADIEAPNSGRGSDRGHMRVAMDPSMGWSQMCESYEIGALNPNMWVAAATAEGREVLTRVGHRLAESRAPEADEPYLLTEELVGPAHDGTTRAGATLRVAERECYASTGGAKIATVPAAADSEATLPNGRILEAREFLSKPQVLSEGCTNTAKVPPGPKDAAWVAAPATLPRSRPLNWVVPKPAPGAADDNWPPADVCAALQLEGLCETVKKVAINREVLAAVSNKNIFHMLQLYVDGFQKGAKVPNSMVVALDDPTAAWLEQRSVAHYTKKIVSRTGSTDNHATSGLKFKVLTDFLSIGCSVLLSDVDVLWMTNPFPHMYRDADVEGMSDGWDEKTAFGHNAGGGTYQMHARNSGMFFLQATNEALAMVKRLARRMETEGTWDQSAYNQEQFLPAWGGHKDVGVSTRVMNYLCNLNSKTWFRFLREDEQLLHGYTPLSLHINYHPEKPDRMRDVHKFYYEGDQKSIWRWNGGEGTKLWSECKGINQRASPDTSDPMIARVLNKKLDWGGCIGCLTFSDGGTLQTSWGAGRWGKASTPTFKEVVFAQFVNAVHLLRFNEAGEFVSTRCSDGEEVKGKLI